MSSRLSLSTVSLSLSATNTTTSSTASFQTHGSEDDESSFLSNGGTYYSSSSSSSKAKKLSKKERQLQKQLQKQEQQRQQQQQQRLRCLCYLDTSLDNQPQEQPSQQPQKQHSSQQQQQQSKISSWHPKRNSKDKKEKDKEAAGRLRRIWNESVIFHWSKPPGSGGSGSRQSASSSPSPSPPSSGYHHHTVNGGESLQNSNGSQVDIGSGSGVPMRHSMSGTDISDEGNHSLSDIEDDLDIDTHLRHLRQGTSANHSTSSPANDNNSYNHHRVSFQGPYGASSSSAKASSSSRPKEDLKAIARHQAELSLHQQPRMGGDDFQYGLDDDDAQLPSMPSMPPPPPPVLSNFGSHIIVNDNDEDDEDEDWDIQSDSGAPSSSPMYSANAREPSCRSTLALPMSTPANNKAYLKKSSNANLGSIRSRQRCLSLPADTVPSSKGFMMSSKPSENWDEDFDIGSADIHVPSKVVENQMSLQMDLYNIKDFASQIEDLKTLRASLRMASSSLKATNPKRHQDLSMLFQRDWEQAEVIIDLGEIAQTSSPTTTSPSSASSSLGPSSLQHAGKKSSEPSLGTLSTKPSMGLKPRRPALSTTAPASNNNNNPLDALSAYQSSQARSESQSSNLTGATLVAGVGSGDAEGDDTAGSTRTSSRASSSTSTSGSGPLRVNIECAIERLAIPQKTPSTSPSITRDSGRATTGNGNGMRKASMAFMKESCSSPAGLGLCTSLMKPLRKHNNIDYDDDDEDYDDYNDGDLEIKYENGLLRFPEGEQPFKGGYHDKEDSSATVKPLRSAGGSPRSPRESGMFQVDMEASFRRYQKYSHYSKRRTTGGVAVPSSGTSRRLSNQDDYDDDADEDEEEEDDGYESYGYGDGSSIGVFTPIPSDRHMQVLKDILMEGLGTEKARQYMFKQGEQDHVRFSVEVIPGLLGHLKALQQRLGSQLVVLQELTVIV
ncbi:hypothetical protein BGW39_007971 [Mortierella sp. 14UC]|nr:hypothetical protein BGW39_007971 [Mortierella sp. 14UC]